MIGSLVLMHVRSFELASKVVPNRGGTSLKKARKLGSSVLRKARLDSKLDLQILAQLNSARFSKKARGQLASRSFGGASQFIQCKIHTLNNQNSYIRHQPSEFIQK